MKALDLSQPQFYAPLKARVTFKTFPKAVNETPTVAAMRARSSAAPVVAPTRARAPHPTQAMARAVRSQIELEIARLSQARTAHVKHALQQIARRSEDLTHDDGKLSERAIDTLCRELTHELQKSSPSVANSNWQGELQG